MSMIASRLFSVARGLGVRSRNANGLPAFAPFCTANSSPAAAPATKAASGSAQGVASADASKATQPAEGSAKQDELQWYMLSGFSGFASRKDLLNVLGNISQVEIDPLLDPNLYPSGRYALHMSPAIAAELTARLTKSFHGKYSLEIGKKLKNWHRASTFGISAKSIRSRMLPPKITKSKLTYIFDKYNLQQSKPLVQIQELTKNCANNEKTQFILHFKTPLDAERAIIENDGKAFDENQSSTTSFFWYHA